MFFYFNTLQLVKVNMVYLFFIDMIKLAFTNHLKYSVINLMANRDKKEAVYPTCNKL
jgi:hypothetical protein